MSSYRCSSPIPTGRREPVTRAERLRGRSSSPASGSPGSAARPASQPSSSPSKSSRAAIADAGLTPSDIDGVATIGDTPHRRRRRDARHLPRLDRRVDGPLRAPDAGRSTPSRPWPAAGAPRPRLPHREHDGRRGDRGAIRRRPRWRSHRRCADITRILTMHAYSASNWLAMHLRRHMHLYGTTREQIGWLAINSRRNAAPQSGRRLPGAHHAWRTTSRPA